MWSGCGCCVDWVWCVGVAYGVGGLVGGRVVLCGVGGWVCCVGVACGVGGLVGGCVMLCCVECVGVLCCVEWVCGVCVWHMEWVG